MMRWIRSTLLLGISLAVLVSHLLAGASLAQTEGLQAPSGHLCLSTSLIFPATLEMSPAWPRVAPWPFIGYAWPRLMVGGFFVPMELVVRDADFYTGGIRTEYTLSAQQRGDVTISCSLMTDFSGLYVVPAIGARIWVSETVSLYAELGPAFYLDLHPSIVDSSEFLGGTPILGLRILF